MIHTRFKKKETKGKTKVSTAALPDIVFMLLLFFLVAATPKQDNSATVLKIENPKASQLSELKRKELVVYVHVGRPLPQYQGVYGTSDLILLNDTPLKSFDDVKSFISDARGRVNPADLNEMIVKLNVDKATPLSVVHKLKLALREVKAYKISYSALPGEVE